MHYIIPVKIRELRVERFGQKVSYVDVFGTGVRVFYSDPNFDLSPLNINSYLIAITDQSRFFIEADNPMKAIEAFYKEYEEGTSCGLESQAIEISKREPIEELPSCPFMKYNKNGSTVCIHGEEEEYEEHMKSTDEESSFGCGCVIDFADYGPRICPIENTWKMYEYDYAIEEHKGFKFKRLNKKCITPEKLAEKRIDILKNESAIYFGATVAKEYHKIKKLHHKLTNIFKELKLNWPE